MTSKKQFYYLLMVLVTLSIGCNISLNKTITIEDGETVRGSQNTINGNILIGFDCKVNGDCRTVNGRIEVGRNSKVRDLKVVNGAVEVENDVQVWGSIQTVNGNVTCESGTKIDREITTINGEIDLTNTIVKHDIITHNGDITLRDKSIVYGDIIIKMNRGKSDVSRRVSIRIEDTSMVEGDIIVRDEDRNVKVYLSGDGKVEGRIKNAEIVK